MNRLHHVWSLLAAAILFAQGTAGAGQTADSLEDLAFLSGCWAGNMGGLDLREQWSEPEAGLMLGTTRYYQDGAPVDFEFGMFVEDETGVTLWPYPQGERSEHGFALVSADDDEYVFENLAHDFPVRIIYVRKRPNGLEPRIEGRDGEARGWSLSRVACPAG